MEEREKLFKPKEPNMKTWFWCFKELKNEPSSSEMHDCPFRNYCYYWNRIFWM